jgi:hypothetical protein
LLYHNRTNKNVPGFSAKTACWFLALKGIVSWNRITIWQFYCIAGNFLSIRWRILNFKIFNFYFKIFKNSVSPLRSFGGTCHLQVPLRREYFPRDVKFCPVRGELFVIVYVLLWTPHHLLPVREPAKDKCWYAVGGFPVRGQNFTSRGKIFSP